MKTHGSFKQQQMARKANHDRMKNDKMPSDGLKGMTQNKPNYTAGQGGSIPLDTGWTKVGATNPNTNYSIEKQDDTGYMTKVLAKKKHG